MEKRGISPVIATVLLIAIVVVLALIIFLWARGFVKESIIKKGENVELTCGKIMLEAVYIPDTGDLQVTNIGNIPIYRFNAKLINQGDIENREFDEGLGIGQSGVVNVGSAEEVRVVPILLGQVKKNNAQVAFICKNEIPVEVE